MVGYSLGSKYDFVNRRKIPKRLDVTALEAKSSCDTHTPEKPHPYLEDHGT